MELYNLCSLYIWIKGIQEEEQEEEESNNRFNLTTPLARLCAVATLGTNRAKPFGHGVAS